MKYNFQLSLFIIFISVFFHASKKQSTIEIPLKIITKTFDNYPLLPKDYYQMEQKVNPLSTYLDTKIEKISGNVNLTNNYFLSCQIDIGNGQKFNMILSTSSFYFWVVGINSKDQYKINNRYDSNKSQTSKNMSIPFNFTYPSGTVIGTYFSDNVRLFTDNSYEIIFGVSSEANAYLIEASGIMGLGKNYENNYSQSIIWQLYNKGVIPTKSFSLKYISDENIKMYLGEEHSDFKNKEKIGQCNLLNKTDVDQLLWTCELKSLSLTNNINNISHLRNYSILFDTSFNGIFFPLDFLNLLSNQLSQFNCFTAENIIICNDSEALPNIYIELGNHYHVLKKENIFFKHYINGNYYYITSNITFKDTTMAIVGYPFFQSFHTKFDPENNVIKFYSEYPDGLIIIRDNDDADDEGKGNSTLKVFLIIFSIIIFIGIIIVIFLFIRYSRKKREVNLGLIYREIDSKTTSSELI